MPAGRYLEVDDRLLPRRSEPVDGTDDDLRTGAPLGCAQSRHRVAPLARDADGRWRVRLELGDRWAELWADESFGWLQVFTGADRRDRSIAVEPMTCGPDAFNPGRPTTA